MDRLSVRVADFFKLIFRWRHDSELQKRFTDEVTGQALFFLTDLHDTLVRARSKARGSCTTNDKNLQQ